MQQDEGTYSSNQTHHTFFIILISGVVIITLVTILLYVNYKKRLETIITHIPETPVMVDNTIVGIREKNIDNQLQSLQSNIDQSQQRMQQTDEETP